MKNSNRQSLSLHFIPQNDLCSDSSVTNQYFTKHQCSYDSGSHSFIQCSWNNKEASGDGCAIYFRGPSNAPSGILDVQKCSFFHCHSTLPSGGVSSLCISSASVSDSVFYDCTCTYTDYQEGGGVLMANISIQPLIKFSSFISCSTGDDSGGCGIFFSHSFLTQAVQSCRFIDCKGVIDDSQGGGAIVNNNVAFVTLTNCLFSLCNTPFQAGGLALSCPSGTTPQPLTFCYFHKNTAKYGNDIFFYYAPNPSSGIIHCFSTSSSDKISYVSNIGDWNNPQKYLFHNN